MLSEKEILEMIKYHEDLSSDYFKESKSLDFGSVNRNLAWNAHRSHEMAVSVLKVVLEIEK